jgi:hypothetical protein
MTKKELTNKLLKEFDDMLGDFYVKLKLSELPIGTSKLGLREFVKSLIEISFDKGRIYKKPLTKKIK